MHLNRNLFGALAVCAALSAPLASLAALVGPVETNRTAFDARVGTQGTDAFADLAAGSLGLPPLNRIAGSFSYNAVAANGLFALMDGGPLTTDTAADSLTLSAFSSSVYGFGADFSVDPSMSAGTLTFTYNNVDLLYTLDIPVNSAGSFFVGFVFGSPIDTSQIKITSSQLDINVPVFLAVDNLTLASAVPELGTFPLIAFGAAALFAASLRRKRGA